MEEWRRRAYLEAMGVTVWESRAPLIEEPVWTESAPTDDAPRSCSQDAGQTSTEPAGMLAEAAWVEAIPEPPPRARSLEPVVGSEAPSPASEAEPGANAIERMDWEALEAAVAGCRACGLCESRNRTVFGVGDRTAKLMLIGEAPGADEDRAGEPFVGRAGQLLDRMLAAIGLSREQVYIANLLKCRPPGNRDPKPEEALQCQAYLMRQIALIQPRLILSVGRISAQHLLRTDTPVGRLRGRWFADGPDGIPLRVTYHPAYLLRSPEQKAKSWEDLTEIRRRLESLASEHRQD
ncbi:uracil-DNA glycosylase [Thiocystis violacea]|uniref:uracil-DNA glycosylase n=1 Tax=Thiocystis violacea TaxID=13725 RepID=UPI00190523AE|nr:uracil-DNA glycosylase [Thiocystis violacea]